MNVAVDAMGGDNAPRVVVQGAVKAATELGIDVTLVGNSRIIARELASCSSSGHVSVHHCEEVVQMNESPLKAVRQKKRASIRVAFDLMKAGQVDAVVSAGNSGAMLAAGVLTLGRLKGVDRPAIAGIFPSEKGYVILIDMGANVDCRPAHLFQFGIMAYAFSTSCMGMKSPKVGLLSIGEEGSKGNEQVRFARELFEESQLNFFGNVEGRDIFTGNVEIVVCDGFVGNVVLKLSEGMAESMTRMLETELTSSLFSQTTFELGRRFVDNFREKLDYERHGGAPLLGINGVGIVCHGGSSERAIKHAIRLASEYVDNRVLEKMMQELDTFKMEPV